ncbi:hypothetical protein EUZ85_16770 [Hahella sp. KA22]|uniref:hypothetical protein n=1 Tax=Hahella sp. KA22 TaxID=1628392 RepID=UPI000FDD148F|nr:hypothetical protein [Hahella sp. KA22]AZZ92291.1 hypothetical protein ENC22_14205 [Hahella sp. KA22]QAY55662.1 hypothetical protein EUZ85_16770 [Hahella sp. KA22]
MAKTHKQIIEAIAQRMYKRRLREANTNRSGLTMCYAVSAVTGRCYVGYNMAELNTTDWGTGGCAENRAAYLAMAYGERLDNMVFFAMNDNSEYFNACSECQRWLCGVHPGRGFLKNQSQEWMISTTRFQPSSGTYVEAPLTEREQETLFAAGDEIDADSREFYRDIRYRQG